MGTDRRMPQRLLRVMTLITVSFLVLAVVHPEPMTVVIAGIAAMTLATAACARYLAVAISLRALGVGHRAREHTFGLDEMPAPQHPSTPGRRRSRAPSPSAAVA